MSQNGPGGTRAALRMILGKQLQALREKAALSHEQAARAICSSPWTVRRMERAEGGLKPLTVKGLLTAYGITDAREIDGFLAGLAWCAPSCTGPSTAGRRRNWTRRSRSSAGTPCPRACTPGPVPGLTEFIGGRPRRPGRLPVCPLRMMKSGRGGGAPMLGAAGVRACRWVTREGRSTPAPSYNGPGT